MSYVKLPLEIEKLNILAHNFWWTWNHDALTLFEQLNPELFAQSRNPVLVLHNTQNDVFEKFAQNKQYVTALENVVLKFNEYMKENETWYKHCYRSTEKKYIYFSAEYGIHESLPIYSGGLGVLSGDHVKSTSDLGIPGVFIGLFYSDGYFIQQIEKDGQQTDLYESHNLQHLGVLPVCDSCGLQVEFAVQLAGREVYVRAYKASIGRVDLYLLDTDLDKNTFLDRQITARLYGGDREMRISQEIILGIGGIRLLEQIGIEGAVFHMNEGHSGFFQLERIRQTMMISDLTFEQAKICCASNCIFTTHTPVPAGNEAFSLPLMHKYFYNYVQDLKISWDKFLKLGLMNEGSDNKYFSLTVFAINFTRFQNGVSELHGRIAKRMWNNLWMEVPEVDNSITHITNGVHVETWACSEVKNYLTSCFGEDWKHQDANEQYWNKIYELPLNDIRRVKKERKIKMISLVRSRLKMQLKRHQASVSEIADVDNFLKDDVLTIGFARRFATYKRATLIFKDLKRLKKIINDSKYPVQFVFAGKAHPQDQIGQKFIKEIYNYSQCDAFKGKIIILENYDMNISSHLVSGVDVWLNNPRRPMEASGTSGQKVPINFGLNFSVLDGWWREGYNGENGWIIGAEKDYPNDEIQDLEDATDFYNTLEKVVIPLYYNSSDDWFRKTQISFVTNIARYSTRRMVMDYMTKLYQPAFNYGELMRADNFKRVYEYVNERLFLKNNWSIVSFLNLHVEGKVIPVQSKYQCYKNAPTHHVEMAIDDTLPGRVYETSNCFITLNVYLGLIPITNICCELVETSSGIPQLMNVYEMQCIGKNDQGVTQFQYDFKSKDNDPKRVRFRIFPTSSKLAQKFELGIAQWY